MSSKFLAAVNRYLTMLAGILIGAVSVIVFMSPFKIAPAGATGMAVILHEVIGTPIGLMILLINIPIQILAWRMLPDGARRVARTVFILVVYSFVIDVLAPFLPEEGVSKNVLLNAIFGGVLGGISTGLVYRAGATFGGSSTLSLILQRRLGTPMSSTYLYIDGFVMGVAGLAFGWESALYAVVALFISGLATDYILEGPSVIRTAMIVTENPDAVANVILNILHRGATGWEGRGMYTGENRWILFVSVSRSQTRELQALVFSADPRAFVVIGQGHMAFGGGFSRLNPGAGLLGGIL